MGSTIAEIDDGGRIVKLNNGTDWEVNNLHIVRTFIWLPGQQVTVIPSSNAKYLNILVNTNNLECVEAKPASRVT